MERSPYEMKISSPDPAAPVVGSVVAAKLSFGGETAIQSFRRQLQAKPIEGPRAHFMDDTSFKDLGLSDEILSAVSEAGYKTPTPIQAQAIPYVLMK